MQQLAQQYQAVDTKNDKYDVGRDRYLRMIDGMIYGEDPKQGFVEGNSFYHPELRFQFKIPGQWRLINAPTMVQMVSPDQKAIMQMTLAQGTDPQAAAQQFVQETSLQVASSSNSSINNLPATTVLGDVIQTDQQSGQTQTIRVIASFIAYGGNTYMMLGMALAQDFNRYSRDVEYSIGSFAELRNQAYLNRQPERLKIVTNPRAQSLQQALLGAGVPQARLNEFAILNGMQLKDQMAQGMLFKAFSGGQ